MSPVVSAQVIGYSKETTFGTFASPTKFVPGAMTVASATTVQRPEQSRGLRDYPIDALTQLQVSGTLTAQLIGEVIGELVSGWFGTGADSVSGAAGTGFTHVFTPQNEAPTFSIELDTDITSKTLTRQIVGCVMDQMVVRNAPGAIAELEFQVVGQREITPASPNYGQPSNPTPVINTQQPIDFSLLTAKFKTVETQRLQDFTITAMNKTQRVFSSNKQIYVTRLVATRREVQLQTTLDFLETQFYLEWIKGEHAEPGLELTWTTAYNITGATAGHPYSITFKLPKMVPQGQFNMGNANDVINQQITWSTTLAESGVLLSTWINGESTKYT
jgi:hypothetical protein